jgi:hypothetical protein
VSWRIVPDGEPKRLLDVDDVPSARPREHPVSNSSPAAGNGPIAETIAFLIGNYMTTLFVVGLIVAAVRILRLRGERSPIGVSGMLLNAFVFWAIGCAQVVNFIMHSVFGDFAAKTIGWAQPSGAKRGEDVAEARSPPHTGRSGQSRSRAPATRPAAA